MLEDARVNLVRSRNPIAACFTSPDSAAGRDATSRAEGAAVAVLRQGQNPEAQLTVSSASKLVSIRGLWLADNGQARDFGGVAPVQDLVFSQVTKPRPWQEAANTQPELWSFISLLFFAHATRSPAPSMKRRSKRQ